MAVFSVYNKPVHKTGSVRTNFRYMFQPYKLPKIVRASNGDWYVEFWYQYPESWPQYPDFKRFKKREGINRIKGLEEKERETQLLARNIELALTLHNYNPFEEMDQAKKDLEKLKIQKIRTSSIMTISDAFEFFLTKKKKDKLEESTIAAYEYAIKWFKLWLAERNKDEFEEIKFNLITEITTEVIVRYLEEQQDESDWTNRTYNNHRASLITIFRFLKRNKRIEVNPLETGAIDKKTSKAEKNKYYPKSIRRIIFPELEKQPYLNYFTKWVYYSCARIIELGKLKGEHIDLDLMKIRIPSTVGKTGAHIGDRTVPICQELHDIIIEMGIDKCPPNHYIFSVKQKPGTTPVPRDYFRDRYLKIKNDTKIDPNYTLYSFKHSRVVDLLAAGYQPQQVMSLTGHTDWTSFMKYCRGLGAVIDEKMKGKTISFDDID